MPEQLSQQPASDVAAVSSIRRLQEYVAAVISLIVVVGTIVMMIIALNYVNSPDLDPTDKFARVKDLLLFINPILGVVIGYYLNRATSEARAETAETAAQSAMTSAQQATEARNVAEAEAQAAESEAEEAKSALKEVDEAAEKMLAEEPQLGSLGEESGGAVTEARMELQMALARAKRLIE